MTSAPRTLGATPRPLRRGYAIASLVLGILSVPTIGLPLVGAMLAARDRQLQRDGVETEDGRLGPAGVVQP